MKAFHSAVSTLTLSLASAAFTILAPGTANAGTTCTIGFGDQTGLSLLWDGSISGTATDLGQPGGFMTPLCTRVLGCGALGVCSTNAGLCSGGPGNNCINRDWFCQESVDGQLWYYEQACSGDWFYIDEAPNTSYGHFHLPPDNDSLNTCFGIRAGAYTMGRQTSSGCVLDADTTLLSRYIVEHQPDQWMRVIRLTEEPFIPSSILVKHPSANVSVLFYDSNGTGWVWGAPAMNTDFTWNLPPTGTFGTVAYVGNNSPSNFAGEASFDNLRITSQN